MSILLCAFDSDTIDVYLSSVYELFIFGFICNSFAMPCLHAASIKTISHFGIIKVHLILGDLFGEERG